MSIAKIRFKMLDKETDLKTKNFRDFSDNAVYNFINDYYGGLPDALLTFLNDGNFDGVDLEGLFDLAWKLWDSLIGWLGLDDLDIDGIISWALGILGLKSSTNDTNIAQLKAATSSLLANLTTAPVSQNSVALKQSAGLEDISYTNLQFSSLPTNLQNIYNQLNDDEKLRITLEVMILKNNSLVKLMSSKDNEGTSNFYETISSYGITQYEIDNVNRVIWTAIAKIGYSKGYSGYMETLEGIIKDNSLRGLSALTLMQDAIIRGDIRTIIEIGNSISGECIKYTGAKLGRYILKYMKFDDRVYNLSEAYDVIEEVIQKIDGDYLYNTYSNHKCSNHPTNLSTNVFRELSNDAKKMFRIRALSQHLTGSYIASDLQHIYAANKCCKHSNVRKLISNQYAYL
jgi:hypothetical protein